MKTIPLVATVLTLSLCNLFGQDEQNEASAKSQVSSTKQSSSSQSVILTDGSNWTLVPRGSVLFLPEEQQEKIGKRPVGNLLPWKKFASLNKSWITAEEVTLRQAEGLHEIDPRRTSYWAKQDKIMVAVYLDAPITVTGPANQTARN